MKLKSFIKDESAELVAWVFVIIGVLMVVMMYNINYSWMDDLLDMFADLSIVNGVGHGGFFNTVKTSIKIGYIMVAVGLIIYGFYRSSRKEEDSGNLY